MLRDTELRALRTLARRKRVPVSTAAYELIEKGLPGK